jgi:hypothetical protein
MTNIFDRIKRASQWSSLCRLYTAGENSRFLEGLKRFEKNYQIDYFQMSMKATSFLIMGDDQKSLLQFRGIKQGLSGAFDIDEKYIGTYANAMIASIGGNLEDFERHKEVFDRMKPSLSRRGLLAL